MKPEWAPRFLFGATLFLLAITPTLLAADREAAAEKQRQAIAILLSDAPPQDKAIPCKQLAIYGDKEAVPALAPLLADKDLASWARIALEAIPGPEADEALRAALPKLSGNLLIGAINSIAVRRDAKAVPALTGKLADGDAEVVLAAAVALGKIGGAEAAQVLFQALANPAKSHLAAIAQGGILCAEGYLTDGKFADATRMYDAVRQADVPEQRRLEATRGAILARQTAGLPLLIEQLRSPRRVEFAMALRTARELNGREVTEAIAAELDRAGTDHGVMLILVLADRADAAVPPKLLEVADKGPKPTRVATLELLDRFHDVSAVPVLLKAAAEADEEVAVPAKATLTRMEGKAADEALLSRLAQSSGKTRQVIIELAALRRMDSAVPAIVGSVEDADADVRNAALGTLGVLGTEQQVGDLVRLVAKQDDPAEREAIELALTAICARAGTKALAQVKPLAGNADSELRGIALRVLATMGGKDALAAVTAALNDPDEAVQDEAVGILATWPNNWPDDASVAEPLLGLVQSGKKRAHQVQGARGYLLYVQQNKKLSNADKFKAVNELLPQLKQPQEKRLAIAALGGIPTGQSLELLVSMAGEAAVAEEACLAIVTVAAAKNLEGATPEARRQALQLAKDKSKSEATQKKASEALNALR